MTEGRTMPVTGHAAYDDQNVFARILRGKVPCRKVYEDVWALAFHDISPQAPVHVLVIPKGRWVSMSDFTAGAADAEIAGFWRAVGTVCKRLGLDANGYRLLVNTGEYGGQEVAHLHVHVVGGRPLGRMLERPAGG